MKYRKRYVDVVARFDTDGKIVPIKLIWHDGTVFYIDRALDICRAASLKAGGAGIRYTCRINNRETYLFLEETRWFVEEICED